MKDRIYANYFMKNRYVIKGLELLGFTKEREKIKT